MNRGSTGQAPGGRGERGSGAARQRHGRDINHSSRPRENTWAVSQSSVARAAQSDGTPSLASAASLLGLGFSAGATSPWRASLPTAPQPAAQLLQDRAPRSTAIPQLRSMAGVPASPPSAAPAASLLGQALDGLAPPNPASMALPPSATNASLDSLRSSRPSIVPPHASLPLSRSSPVGMLVPQGSLLPTAPGSVTQLHEAHAPNASFGSLLPNRPSAVPAQPSLAGLPRVSQESSATPSLQASLLGHLWAISLAQQAAPPSPHFPHEPAARSLQESIIERSSHSSATGLANATQEASTRSSLRASLLGQTAQSLEEAINEKLAAARNNVTSQSSLTGILSAAREPSTASSLQDSLLGQPAQSLRESIIEKLAAARNDQTPRLVPNSWSAQQMLPCQDELLLRLLKEIVDADQPGASSLSQPHSPPSAQSISSQRNADLLLPSQRNADLLRQMLVSQAAASLPATARDQSQAGLLRQMLVAQAPASLPATARGQSQLPSSQTNVHLPRQMLVSQASASLPVTARDQSQLLERLTQENLMKDQLISLILARRSSARTSPPQASLQGAGSTSSDPISGERHNEEVRSHESDGEGSTLARRQNKDERWMVRYEELKRFKQGYGHCNVPHGWSKDRRLSWWVMNQRAQYQLMRRGRENWMTDERVALLDGIGFCWTPTARPGKPRDG